MKEATQLCTSRTGPSTATYIRDVVKDGVVEFMDLACNKVRNLAECRANEAELTKAFEDQMKKGVPKQTTSALYPFLQLATRLEWVNEDINQNHRLTIFFPVDKSLSQRSTTEGE